MYNIKRIKTYLVLFTKKNLTTCTAKSQYIFSQVFAVPYNFFNSGLFDSKNMFCIKLFDQSELKTIITYWISFLSKKIFKFKVSKIAIFGCAFFKKSSLIARNFNKCCYFVFKTKHACSLVFVWPKTFAIEAFTLSSHTKIISQTLYHEGKYLL